MNYSLEIQRALTRTLVLETGYVGSRGVKFNLGRTFNLVDRITGIRPNPNDIQGTYLDNSQQTNYNSWQTSLKQRFSRSLAFNVHYTWGKALSYAGGDVGAIYLGDSRTLGEDFNNFTIERSLSSGDVAHNLTVDWLYQAPTPFANSRMGRGVLGGWQLSGIWNLDLSMGKSFGLTETTKLELRADMVNALNHTQYSGIATNLSGLAFGQATSAALARVIQLQLRLGF